MLSSRISSIKNITKKLNGIGDKFQLPEKYKGTVIEKWTKYWKQVATDYKDVATDIVKSAYDRPKRAAILYGSGIFGYYCLKTNPTYQTYLAQLRQYQCDITFVAEPIRNPKAIEYLQLMERCHNQGTLKRISFGIFSILWIADYNDDLNLYKAVCPYLGPKIETFHTRIVDFGILDKWIFIERNLKDFDVNY